MVAVHEGVIYRFLLVLAEADRDSAIKVSGTLLSINPRARQDPPGPTRAPTTPAGTATQTLQTEWGAKCSHGEARVLSSVLPHENFISGPLVSVGPLSSSERVQGGRFTWKHPISVFSAALIWSPSCWLEYMLTNCLLNPFGCSITPLKMTVMK